MNRMQRWRGTSGACLVEQELCGANKINLAALVSTTDLNDPGRK
jgi:hypothetical protein